MVPLSIPIQMYTFKCIPLKKDYYIQILAFSFFNFFMFTFSYKTLRAWNI